MKVHNNIAPISATNPVVTMGMFDGVHKGHLMLISAVTEYAKKIDGESVVITFWPHPKVVLNPENTKLRYLTTIEEKIELLKNAGVDHIMIIPFDKEISQKSACEFTDEIIVRKLKTHHLIAGFDHHFGRNREGSFQELKKCALNYNFSVDQVSPLLIDNTIISSTLIRQLIENGNIVDANKYLGYEFFIFGKVIKGNQIGRSIDFPTANIEIKDSHKLKPGIGVYAVKVKYEGLYYNGMLNIGYRPTITEDYKTKSIEVHIFDFNKNIYEKNVSVIFKKKIREEKKFNNIAELKSQLLVDKQITLDILNTI